MYGATGLRQNGLISRAAASAEGTAASVEQAQPDAVFPENRDQFDFSFVQFPAGCQESAVLVGIGITQHDLLDVAA